MGRPFPPNGASVVDAKVALQTGLVATARPESATDP